MFKLTEEELDNAFSSINHHGYSTMLPEPLEWESIKNNWDDIKKDIAVIDLDVYNPYKPMRIFAPKNRANIRVLHLLHPQDLLIYTALILIIKNDIEDARISKKKSSVFSYRTDKSNDKELYDSINNYNLYLSELDKKSKKKKIKYIGIADIADFFPSIYQHRLENAIETIATSDRSREIARVLVQKFISRLMDRNSYGIPVGPYASRILGEAILIDVDAYLSVQKINFVRWVDDYNIFCKSEHDAQIALFSLAEWLYDNHGLKLQSSKTNILPSKRFRDKVLENPSNNLTDEESIISLLKGIGSPAYNDEDENEDSEEINEELLVSIVEEIQKIDLIEMLKGTISDKELINYDVVKFVLRKLPLLDGIELRTKKEVLNIILENVGLLYPLADEIAKYIISFNDLPKKEKRKIAKMLLKPLDSKSNEQPPAYYIMWILHIFTTSEDWNHIKRIIKLYQDTQDDVVKRYAALVISTSGTRADVLVIKNDFTSSSSLVKLAILKSSRKLGKDERKHWMLANQVKGVIEKKI